MKLKAIAAVIAAVMIMLCCCASIAGDDKKTAETSAGTNTPADTDDEDDAMDDLTDEEQLAAADAAQITLDGTSAVVAGSDAAARKITLTDGGSYYVTGTLEEGQIVVNAPSDEKVDIYLNGADITCTSSAPIAVENADRVTLHLVEGSTTVLKDSSANTLTACVSAKDDLTIKGKGTLYVYGSAKHGIKSSNDVKIKNGNIIISSINAGIYGEDTVQITGGNITVTSSKDGIKATNETEAAKGYVSIEAAEIDIQNASGNGIEAVTGVTISSDSTVKIHSVKKPINCDTQDIAEGSLVTY